MRKKKNKIFTDDARLYGPAILIGMVLFTFLTAGLLPSDGFPSRIINDPHCELYKNFKVADLPAVCSHYRY